MSERYFACRDECSISWSRCDVLVVSKQLQEQQYWKVDTVLTLAQDVLFHQYLLTEAVLYRNRFNIHMCDRE